MTLENNLLTVEISEMGAELQSIRSKVNGHQYLWQGDLAFWGRRSPVLFPIVGKAWDGVVRYGNDEVAIGQHGFARDCMFTPVENDDDNTLTFRLQSDESTLKLFPFRFTLDISYTLIGERLTVAWKV
ncbi:MAG: aldose 1-epimerase family protein, partial [Muribaculaceae bacterium]|nr:aldose 1-epimerase family protein [Muribaculaceae bacterium]